MFWCWLCSAVNRGQCLWALSVQQYLYIAQAWETTKMWIQGDWGSMEQKQKWKCDVRQENIHLSWSSAQTRDANRQNGNAKWLKAKQEKKNRFSTQAGGDEFDSSLAPSVHHKSFLVEFASALSQNLSNWHCLPILIITLTSRCFVSPELTHL